MSATILYESTSVNTWPRTGIRFVSHGPDRKKCRKVRRQIDRVRYDRYPRLNRTAPDRVTSSGLRGTYGTGNDRRDAFRAGRSNVTNAVIDRERTETDPIRTVRANPAGDLACDRYDCPRRERRRVVSSRIARRRDHTLSITLRRNDSGSQLIRRLRLEMWETVRRKLPGDIRPGESFTSPFLSRSSVANTP